MSRRQRIDAQPFAIASSEISAMAVQWQARRSCSASTWVRERGGTDDRRQGGITKVKRVRGHLFPFQNGTSLAAGGRAPVATSAPAVQRIAKCSSVELKITSLIRIQFRTGRGAEVPSPCFGRHRLFTSNSCSTRSAARNGCATRRPHFGAANVEHTYHLQTEAASSTARQRDISVLCGAAPWVRSSRRGKRSFQYSVAVHVVRHVPSISIAAGPLRSVCGWGGWRRPRRVVSLRRSTPRPRYLHS